jgi:cell division protein FtsW
MVLAVVAVGFLKQPDLGSTFLVGMVSITLMFVSGVKFIYLAGVAGAGVAAIIGMIMVNPERMSRVLSVFRPDEVSSDDSHQIEQALASFQSGGVWGVGYGNSLRKEGFLPESHTDCILAMAGEELGLACTVLVVVAYTLLLVAGMTVSLRSQDKFGRLLAFGMTFHLCFSAGFNIAVVTKMAPTKGLALPFMSYGGSNLIASMVALGFILSVACRVDRKAQTPRRSIGVDTLPTFDPAPGALAVSLPRPP